MSVAPGGSVATDLIPGKPSAVRALARKVDAYADDASDAATQLNKIDTGAWVGKAADAFRGAIDEVPEDLTKAVSAFADASGALQRYADALEEAQAEAARAIEMFEEAERTSSAWSQEVAAFDAAAVASDQPSRGAAPSATDPGADLRAEAERKLAAARAAVEDAAGLAATTLRSAGDAAPNEPGFWSKAWKGAKEFAGGAWDATYGMGEFVFKLSPNYMMMDPAGYAENVEGLAKGVVYGVQNPKDFAKAALNWDMWRENPARALGELVPTVALTLASGGAGAAGKGAAALRRTGTATKKLSRASAKVGAGARQAATAPTTFKLGPHVSPSRLAKRGWTPESIGDTIRNPVRTVATRDRRRRKDAPRMDDPATAYYANDHDYVVRNDRTGDIVQIKDRNNPDWKDPWDD